MDCRARTLQETKLDAYSFFEYRKEAFEITSKGERILNLSQMKAVEIQTPLSELLTIMTVHIMINVLDRSLIMPNKNRVYIQEFTGLKRETYWIEGIVIKHVYIFR